MKLPELKNKFKSKYAIRIVAGVLIVALAGTGVSSYSVSAAKGFGKAAAESTETAKSLDTEKSSNAAEVTKTDAEDALSDALNNSITINEKEIGKEETVYVLADSTGKSKEVIVSDHLINQGDKATLEDASTLKDITNVKGDETFTQNGTKLIWQADGNDIYYQGTSKEAAPVDEKITYYLDGKEITPEELAGKSGKVTIRVDYTNNAKVKTTVEGKETEVCVPFVAISGLVLDDSYKNIKVSNGKVVADGNNNLVIGYALPGLKDSLNIKEKDFDTDIHIPDYFEVTADVENFALNMTMTVVMNANNFISTEGDNDFSTMDEMIDHLTDATSQLQDGSFELADGVTTLRSKMGEFSGGVNTLKNGIQDYTNGASTLSGGIGTLKNGVDSLAGNVPALTDGVGQLKSGADSAVSGAAALTSGAGGLKNGAEQLAKGTSDLSVGADGLSAGADKLVVGVQSVATGAKELLDGANSLSAGATGLNDGVGALTAKIEGMGTDLASSKAAIQSEFSANAGMSCEEAASKIGELNQLRDLLVQGINAEAGGDTGLAGQYYAQVNAATGTSISNAAGAAVALVNIDNMLIPLQAGTAKVEGAVGVIDTVSGSLSNEETANQLAALKAGAGNLATGAGNLAAGMSGLSAGADQVVNGVQTLSAGAKELSAGANQVEAGANQLFEGTTKVAAGAEALSGGLGTLDAGLSTLNEKAGALGSGVSQLKNGADQLAAGASTLTSNNSALVDGAQTLSDGTLAIIEGVGTLDDGAHKLADGILQFNEEGIEKILNSYNGDVQPLLERIQAVLTAGEDYQTYTDIADGVNGSVKFIYKTDAVKASN